MVEIGKGLCKCGCGETTNIVRKARKELGLTRGQHRSYINGHQRRVRRNTRQCTCGCGKDVLEPRKFVWGHNRRRTDIETQFVVDKKTGCWIWQWGKSHKGTRGMLNNVTAYRIYHEKYKGPIPEGLEIDHLCFNGLCVNPEHLEDVTHQENMRRRNMRPQNKHVGGRKKRC